MGVITVITPNKNGGRFLARCLRSLIVQRQAGLRLRHILVDGGSSDDSMEIAGRYSGSIDEVLTGPDAGPAAAINRGLARARGDVVAWLNADDVYDPGALMRVADYFSGHPEVAFAFGRCRIIDENDREIHRGITRFKECFHPVSSRFTFQCLNYISQPSLFIRRDAAQRAGGLREDLHAAWDYEYLLRLWRVGTGGVIPGPPLAAFRRHPGSIGGKNFRQQFKEEYELARDDAGRFSPQTILHFGVRWGIVAAYSLMSRRFEVR
jgi:GT2 family glycosyltransferase